MVARSPSTSALVATAVAAAVAAGVAANVAQFATVELQTGDEYEALRVKDGHDAAALVAGHFDDTKRRFELTAQLRAAAPGARLDIADAPLVVEELVGLGLADEVVTGAGAVPTIDATTAARLDQDVVASGELSDVGAYAIAVAPGRAVSLTLVRGPDRTYVADDRLLRDERP